MQYSLQSRSNTRSGWTEPHLSGPSWHLICLMTWWSVGDFNSSKKNVNMALSDCPKMRCARIGWFNLWSSSPWKCSSWQWRLFLLESNQCELGTIWMQMGDRTCLTPSLSHLKWVEETWKDFSIRFRITIVLFHHSSGLKTRKVLEGGPLGSPSETSNRQVWLTPA